jgi:hypothetical protein
VVVEIATGGTCPDLVYINDADHAGDDHAGKTQSQSILGADLLDALVDDANDAEIIESLVMERQRYATGVAAGEVATQLACGFQPDAYGMAVGARNEDPSDSDASELRSLTDKMDEGSAAEWLTFAYRAAEVILRERWDDVERVAAALVEHRTLNRGQLEDLLRPGGEPC